jgi:hypothetical protein
MALNCTSSASSPAGPSRLTALEKLYRPSLSSLEVRTKPNQGGNVMLHVTGVGAKARLGRLRLST